MKYLFLALLLFSGCATWGPRVPSFNANECYIKKNYDSWETPIYKILEVGEYSYHARLCESYGCFSNLREEIIRFDNQNRYRRTMCPPAKEGCEK